MAFAPLSRFLGDSVMAAAQIIRRNETNESKGRQSDGKRKEAQRIYKQRTSRGKTLWAVMQISGL